MSLLPINCNQIDHYTLIVPNAKKISDFHINVLGFQLMRIQLVNAGSALEGKYDMLNYVLSWPDNRGGVLVVTEGLTQRSIFYRFMQKFGSGIHHIAFEVEDLEKAFEILKSAGIAMTSPQIMKDLLTGLKQIFLDNQDTGIFIELIERPSEDLGSDASKPGVFTSKNMAGLAKTMESYLEEQKVSIEQGMGIEGYSPQSNYYQVDRNILGVIPSQYLVAIKDLSRSAAFFSQTLDLNLEKQSADSFLLKPTNLAMPYLQYFYSQGANWSGLKCRIDKLNQAISVLEKLKISYQIENNVLILNKEYAGYHLQLSEN